MARYDSGPDVNQAIAFALRQADRPAPHVPTPASLMGMIPQNRNKPGRNVPRGRGGMGGGGGGGLGDPRKAMRQDQADQERRMKTLIEATKMTNDPEVIRDYAMQLGLPSGALNVALSMQNDRVLTEKGAAGQPKFGATQQGYYEGDLDSMLAAGMDPSQLIAGAPENIRPSLEARAPFAGAANEAASINAETERQAKRDEWEWRNKRRSEVKTQRREEVRKERQALLEQRYAQEIEEGATIAEVMQFDKKEAFWDSTTGLAIAGSPTGKKAQGIDKAIESITSLARFQASAEAVARTGEAGSYTGKVEEAKEKLGLSNMPSYARFDTQKIPLIYGFAKSADAGGRIAKDDFDNFQKMLLKDGDLRLVDGDFEPSMYARLDAIRGMVFNNLLSAHYGRNREEARNIYKRIYAQEYIRATDLYSDPEYTALDKTLMTPELEQWLEERRDGVRPTLPPGGESDERNPWLRYVE